MERKIEGACVKDWKEGEREGGGLLILTPRPRSCLMCMLRPTYRLEEREDGEPNKKIKIKVKYS